MTIALTRRCAQDTNTRIKNVYIYVNLVAGNLLVFLGLLAVLVTAWFESCCAFAIRSWGYTSLVVAAETWV